MTLGSTIYCPASSANPQSTGRLAVIYPASQLSGIVGQTLTSLYLSKITATNLIGTPNMKIYLKNTSSTDLGSADADWATLITGATKVYDDNPSTATAGAVGWKQLLFSTNYTFATSTNLMVLFEYVNTGNTINTTWEYEYTSPCVNTSNNNTSKYVNTIDGVLATTLNSSNYRRPRIGFDYLVACPAPNNIAVSAITTNSATATWTAGGTETSWDYAIKPAGTGAPTTFTNTTSTTANTSSLSPNTSYDLYVRAVCGGTNGNSAWKGPYNFKTACGAATYMYEGFESYATGNIVPDCWVRMAPATTPGSQTITTTTPATGIRNMYQLASTTQTPVIVALPEFSNVNAGTNWLRFKARVSATGGKLTVGYVTDVTDMSTFSSIEELSINNIIYTVPEAEYKVIIPNSVPAGARLAIVNKADGKSYYWDDVYWEQIPTCFVPTNFAVSNITTSGATLSWSAPTTVPANGYDIYYSTTNTTPTPSTIPTTNSPSTTANLTGLTDNTLYYVWIRTRCSNTDQSSWIALPSLKTNCLPTSSMYEGFEAYTSGSIVPDCWVRMVAATTPGSQTISTTTPATGTKNIYQYTSTTQTPVIVALPVFSNVNAGTHWLRFKARATAAGGSLYVGYVTDITDLSTFSTIQELTINNTLYTTSDAEYKVIIPTSVPSGARLAIVNKADGKSYYWDDVYWEVIPTCIETTALVISNITATSGTVSWTPPTTAPANGYDVYYSLTNTPPTAATTPNTNSAITSINLNGLTPCTTYFVWIRSRCSNTDQSVWAATTLSTGSSAVNVPYVQNFEGAIVPALPNCTSNQNVGTGNNWVTESAPGYGFTTKVLKYNYNTSNAANTWFYTPGINLTAGTLYEIKFDYGNNSSSASFVPEKLKVAYGTSPLNTAMVNPIIDLPNINDANLHTGTYTFTVPATGIYYFGFNAYSAANMYYLYVDNIKIDLSLATAEVSTKETLQVYPNPFQDVITISNTRDVKMINVMDATGRLVKTIEKPSNQINLGELKSGLYVLQLLHKDGTTSSVKAMKK
jgi:hypothetical protein